MSIPQVSPTAKVGERVYASASLASEQRDHDGLPFFLVRIDGSQTKPMPVYARYLFEYDTRRGRFRRNDTDYDPERPIIAQSIRYHRQRCNFTQQELAERLGINQQSVALWESGRNIPLLTNVKHLAQLLNISVEQLFEAPPV